MVAVDSFAIHVTYTCPLSCAHCCFSSSPKNRDRLHFEHIRETIQEIPRDTRLVAFTGGEPFLLGKQLDELVKLATSLGFTTRVVTSAYWAKSPRSALDRLLQISQAGLSEISISWDDFHEEFVPFSCIKSAYAAAKELGLTAAINTVQAANSRWTAKRIAEELGLPADHEDIFSESPLNLTGRAESELRARESGHGDS
ncbi:radical SAM protein [Streptomyces sp. NPDC056704]|uniref:radical SAM protein n=1 Tax=Streptomyces sp. NPDC056704 TaxID=3345917 RepID=UPI0036C07F23